MTVPFRKLHKYVHNTRNAERDLHIRTQSETGKFCDKPFQVVCYRSAARKGKAAPTKSGSRFIERAFCVKGQTLG